MDLNQCLLLSNRQGEILVAGFAHTRTHRFSQHTPVSRMTKSDVQWFGLLQTSGFKAVSNLCPQTRKYSSAMHHQGPKHMDKPSSQKKPDTVHPNDLYPKQLLPVTCHVSWARREKESHFMGEQAWIQAV